MFDPRRHTIPIFQFIPPDTSESEGEAYLIGSGVFLQAADRHFIVTAAHVLEDKECSRCIGFGYYDNGAIRVAADTRMLILHAKAYAWEGDPQRAKYKDKVDVSVITPTVEILPFLLAGYEPYDFLSDTQEDKPEWFIVCGWPGELVTFNRYYEKFDTFAPITFNAPLGDSFDVERAEGNPHIHQALKFDRKGDFEIPEGLEKFPDLHGVSGGGVWAMREEDYNEYPAAARCLAGIAVEDHVEKGTVLFVKVEHIIQLLRQSAIGPRFHMAKRVRVLDPSHYGIDEGFIYTFENNGSGWVYLLTPSLDAPAPLDYWIPEAGLVAD